MHTYVSARENAEEAKQRPQTPTSVIAKRVDVAKGHQKASYTSPLDSPKI